MSCCPGEPSLKSLLDERLPETERDAIATHLEQCATCQAKLERLTEYATPLVGLMSPSDPQSIQSQRVALPPIGKRTDPGWTLPDGTTSNRISGSWLATEPMIEPTSSKIPLVQGYEILSTLGHGGMGVVYKARQHGLDRLVALKMIRGGSHAGPEHLARFQIEAWSVARLRHPYVVQIHDVGEADGQPYVALELLEGGSLAARINGIPQPQRPSAELLQKLAQAIASAHRAGVVHRDLKSSNILFTAEGTPKIADFGLAKRIDEEDGQTQTGQVMGSPSFMAPEQANGQAREVGPAADIYSLGAILYEMLTGRPPFKGTSPMETLLQVVNDEPVPPSRLRSGVSRDLETICLKCLEKDPGRRYADAEALALDLGLHLAGSGILARPTGPRERIWKWVMRQPAVAALVGLGMIGIITLIGFVWASEWHRYAIARVAERESRLARPSIQKGRLDEAKEHIDRLHELLADLQADSRLEDAFNLAVGEIRRYDDRFAQQIREQMGQERLREFDRLRTKALYLDARSGPQSEDIKATRDATQAALDVFGEELKRPWNSETSLSMMSQSDRAEAGRGLHQLLLIQARATARPLREEDSTVQATRALAILDQAGTLHSPTRSLHLIRAECLAKLGDEAGADRQRFEAEKSGAVGAYEYLLDGQEHFHRGEWSRAIACFEASLQKEPKQIWPQYLIARVRIFTKQMELARVGLTACLARSEEFWLFLDRGYASAEEGLEKLASARGKPDRWAKPREAEARASFVAAADDYEKALSLAGDDLQRHALFNNRGILSVRRQDLDAAASDFEEEIRLQPRHFEGYLNLAEVYRKRRDYDRAIELCDQAITMAPGRAGLWSRRAELMEAQASGPESTARAIADLGQAIRLESEDRPARADDLIKRGRLFTLSDRHEEALADCDAALEILPNDPVAHLIRVESLLKLKRHADVISSCDAYLSRERESGELQYAAKTSAEIIMIRGMAHAESRDYPAAIRDYTQAATLRPDDAQPLIRRGWSYLVSDASRLALSDFEVALRLDPNDGDAWNGRGYARILQGQLREAISDAEEAIRHGGPTSRTAYNAARIYARAVGVITSNPLLETGVNRGRPASLQVADEYQDRAQQLLKQALERLPESQRPAFWKDVIQTDPALAAIRRRAKFSQMAGQHGRQAK